MIRSTACSWHSRGRSASPPSTGRPPSGALSTAPTSTVSGQRLSRAASRSATWPVPTTRIRVTVGGPKARDHRAPAERHQQHGRQRHGHRGGQRHPVAGEQQRLGRRARSAPPSAGSGRPPTAATSRWAAAARPGAGTGRAGGTPGPWPARRSATCRSGDVAGPGRLDQLQRRARRAPAESGQRQHIGQPQQHPVAGGPAGRPGTCCSRGGRDRRRCAARRRRSRRTAARACRPGCRRRAAADDSCRVVTRIPRRSCESRDRCRQAGGGYQPKPSTRRPAAGEAALVEEVPAVEHQVALHHPAQQLPARARGTAATRWPARPRRPGRRRRRRRWSAAPRRAPSGSFLTCGS